jgi:hypothetical protein
MLKREITCAILLGLAAGCVGPGSLPRPALVAVAPEHHLDKDYTLGRPKVVPIGGCILRVDETWVQKRYPNFAVMDRAVTLETADQTIRLPHGALLRFLGTARHGGVDYLQYQRTADLDGPGEIYYFRADLTMADFVYIKDKVLFAKGITPIRRSFPGTVKLPVAVTAEALPGTEDRHYALLFQGRDGAGIQVACQEYRADGTVAGSAKTQVVPGASPVLTCQGAQVKVLGCSELGLEVMVISD